MTFVTLDVYQKNGHANRYEYLQYVAESYGMDIESVCLMAGMLGEDEDFDGLINTIQDMEYFA